MIALPNVEHLLAFLSAGTQQIVVALTVVPLAAGVVGLGGWRETFAALARGEAPAGAGRLGLSLGLGALLGEVLSFSAPFAGAEQLNPDGAGLVFGFRILWGIALLVSLVLFLRWIVAGAATWLEVVAAGRSPRPAYAAGLAVGGSVLALWFALLLSFRAFAPLLTSSSSLPEVLVSIAVVAALIGGQIAIVTLQHALTLPALVSLWAFPLAAWFWRERAGSSTGSSWTHLDAPAHRLPFPRQAPLQPRTALRIGLAGGLAFCGLLLLVRLGLRLALPAETRDLDLFKLAVGFGQIGLAILTQALIAAVVGARARRLGALHGLFAAFVGGCAMAGGALGINLLLGGTIDPAFAWQTFSSMVNGGAVLALPAALAASALAGRAGHTRGRAADGRDVALPVPG
jgi:hypothetical protein